MAFNDNWARHLFAPITGEGFDDSLARDFWRDDEDLWRTTPAVPWRWFKLFFVYIVSGVVQIIVLPTFVGSVIWLITGRAWNFLLIAMALAAVFAFLGAIWGATMSCLEVAKALRSNGSQEQANDSKGEPETKNAISQTDAQGRDEDDPVIGDQWKRDQSQV